ncbi:MAG TPA: hypothetical protein VEX39_17955 [Thermoleophilaceae bacterium]|nr:hypothetical protein [Thermoleophilaceae bacterium]
MTGAPNTFASYLGALRAHRLAALLVFAATLLGAAAYLQVRGQDYKATSEVLVTPIPADQGGVLGLPLITEAPDATRVSQTAAALLRNNRAAQITAQRLPEGWDRDRVLGAVAVEPRGESNVIALTGSADDPDLAAELANKYTRAALRVRNQELKRLVPSRLSALQRQTSGNLSGEERSDLARRAATLRSIRDSGDPTLALAQTAIAPRTASSPSPVLIAVAAVLVGAGLAVGVALLLSVTNKRLSDEEELLRLSPYPVLAHVADSTRQAGRAQAAEAFRTLLAQLEAARPQPNVVLITSASSGDGKTSSALSLARAARETGKSVVLLAFDLRKTPEFSSRGASRRLDLLPVGEGGARHFAIGAPLSDGLTPAAEDPDLRFALPTAVDARQRAVLGREMPRLIAEASSLADLVIVDSSPLGEVGDALALLDSVDATVVVARVGQTSRSAYQRMTDLISRSGKQAFGLVVIGSVTEGSSYYRDLAGVSAQAR